MEGSLESISELPSSTAELKKLSPGHQKELYFSKAGWLENLGHFFASFCFLQPSRRFVCSPEVPTARLLLCWPAAGFLVVTTGPGFVIGQWAAFGDHCCGVAGAG